MVDMLSQEEIDALLSGGDSDSSGSDETLTPEEIDALGEVGNISMGTAATTLFTLLGQKVTITTPKVSIITYEELVSDYDDPCVTINVRYKEGIEGINILILQEADVKIITDLMMGGDGTNVSDELTDLHLSAIGEAMNQMIGSSSTSLSEMLGEKVDISPPEPQFNSLKDLNFEDVGISSDSNIIRIAFRMTVGDLIDSQINQVMPIDVAKQLVNNLMNKGNEPEPEPEVIPEPVVETQAPETVQHQAQQPVQQAPPMQQPMGQQQYQQAPQQYQQAPQQYQQAPQQYQQAPQQYQQPPMQQVNAQPVQFESFDENGAISGYNNNISIIKDVPLEITVELGRTRKRISEILDFAPGSVIELDKLVGEALDILANGKKIATGEVVVVDENYGIKITDIIVPEQRLSNI
ncbi:MAG: flagellar motor switch phosphatase FliY [Clostridiales bacterium]|nr:flagellar motor switch phosphatase FliY [Clostridiales bacterium]